MVSHYIHLTPLVAVLFLFVCFSISYTYWTATNCLTKAQLTVESRWGEKLLSEGEVKEGNRVWHVDSGLNPAGALNGQLLKFNCWPCLLGRPSEHWWGIFQSYWGRGHLLNHPSILLVERPCFTTHLTPVCLRWACDRKDTALWTYSASSGYWKWYKCKK